jgi:exodeoxyribonuclease-5
MQLTPEQKHVITELLKFEKPIQTLGGYAGTGKTTVIQNLRRFLPTWAVCAYTGKAANILRKKKIDDASTIHSLIYVPQKDAAGNIVLDANGSPIFILNPDLSAEGIIVDEASMVSKDLYDDLKSFNKPLIFVGDHGQLEPIGSDVNLMKSPDFKLEQIHRNAGEIAHFAEFVRKGFRPAAFEMRSSGKVQFISKFQADQYIANVDQVICAFNKTRVEINRKVRKEKGYEKNWPNVGEKVMCLRNNKLAGLFNGMQGTVDQLFKTPKNKMTFISDGKHYDILFDPTQFNKEKYDFSMDRDDPNPFDFCYCITCHKSQGDEFDNVLVLEQKCDMWDHRRWTYTAASRAKVGLIWAS